MDVCIVCVYSVFVLSCVQIAALRWAAPLSKESYRLCKNQEPEKSAKVEQRAVEPQMNFAVLVLLIRSLLERVYFQLCTQYILNWGFLLSYVMQYILYNAHSQRHTTGWMTNGERRTEIELFTLILMQSLYYGYYMKEQNWTSSKIGQFIKVIVIIRLDLYLSVLQPTSTCVFAVVA
jgi:hypothetical protein